MTQFTRSATLAALALGCAMLAPHAATAQRPPREFRIEVKDRDGRPVAEAMVTFKLTVDSVVVTDSSGIAEVSLAADSVLDLRVVKIGFEPRNARIRLGSAPAFTLKISMGTVGASLPEVLVTDEYPGEPWRKAFELRKKRGGGLYRDLSYFAAGQVTTISEWFNAFPGVRTSAGPFGEINISRCTRLGVWIDGQHATAGQTSYRSALQSVPAQDIAAVEIYTNIRPAQYTGFGEDCTILIWTRHR